MYYKVMNLGGDTFGDPLFHKALQNQPFSLVKVRFCQNILMFLS